MRFFGVRRSIGISCMGLVAALFLASPAVWGIEWYVNNRTGDDSRDGRSEAISGASGPFRSIGRALRAAGAGDRVILAKTAEPYRESITLQGGDHSGIPLAPFMIVGNGAVLDGRREVPAGGWEFVRGHLFRFQPERMSFQTLYVGEKIAERVMVEAQATELPELAPLQWCLWRGYIYFRVEPNKLPSAYTIYSGGLPDGITLYEVRNVIVTDLTIRGFQLDGCNAHDGVRSAMLTGVTAEGNGRSGFSVGGASRLILKQCDARKNGVAQFRTEGYAKTRIQDCRFESGPGVEVAKHDHASVDSSTP